MQNIIKQWGTSSRLRQVRRMAVFFGQVKDPSTVADAKIQELDLDGFTIDTKGQSIHVKFKEPLKNVEQVSDALEILSKEAERANLAAVTGNPSSNPTLKMKRNSSKPMFTLADAWARRYIALFTNIILLSISST